MNAPELAAELIQQIKTEFINKDGLLSRNYPVGDLNIFEHFDDIAPFLLYWGEGKFLEQQLDRLLELDLGVQDVCLESGVLTTRNLDEWLGGLHLVWQKTGSDSAWKLLNKSVKYVQENIFTDDYLAAGYYPELGIRTDYYEPWSAGILEVACEMRTDFPDFFENAKRVFESWTRDEFFQELGFFRYRVFKNPGANFIQQRISSRLQPFRRPSRPLSVQVMRRSLSVKKIGFILNNSVYGQLMKSNSTPAFAMISFANSGVDSDFWRGQLRKWLNGILGHFFDNGRVYSEYYPKAGGGKRPGIIPAFILVDVICDASKAFDEFKEYLAHARAILDYQVNIFREEGLLPLEEGVSKYHLDSQVDFSISLRRFSNLTGEASYLEVSNDLIHKTLKSFRSNPGYQTFLGNDLREAERDRIDPKYNALVLKGLAHLHTIDNDLYENHDLFKDR